MFTLSIRFAKITKVMALAYTFSLSSMVHGYHEYKTLWTNLVNGEELVCKQEVGNPCNSQAVVVKKETSHVIQVVGHVPRQL